MYTAYTCLPYSATELMNQRYIIFIHVLIHTEAGKNTKYDMSVQ